MAPGFGVEGDSLPFLKNDKAELEKTMADKLATIYPTAATMPEVMGQLVKVMDAFKEIVESIGEEYLKAEATREMVGTMLHEKDEEIHALQARIATMVPSDSDEDGDGGHGEGGGRPRKRARLAGDSAAGAVGTGTPRTKTGTAIGEGPDIDAKGLTRLLLAADTAWIDAALWTCTNMTPELARVIVSGMTKSVVEKEKHKPTQEGMKAMVKTVQAELERAAAAKTRVRFSAVEDIHNRFFVLYEADHLVTSGTGSRAARSAAIAAGCAVLSPNTGMTPGQVEARKAMNSAAMTAANGAPAALANAFGAIPGGHGAARAFFGAAATNRGRGGPRGGFRAGGRGGGGGRGFFGTCFNCGEVGHRASACPNGGGDGAEGSEGMVADKGKAGGRGGGRGRGGRDQ